MENNTEKQKAIIYVRGHKKEFQEIVCLLYAKDAGIEILFATDDLDDVYNFEDECDVLLVTNISRISRDKMEYLETLNKLKEHGIKLESASNANMDKIANYIDMAFDLARLS